MGTETDGVFSGPIPAVYDHFLRPVLASGPRDIAGRLLISAWDGFWTPTGIASSLIC